MWTVYTAKCTYTYDYTINGVTSCGLQQIIAFSFNAFILNSCKEARRTYVLRVAFAVVCIVALRPQLREISPIGQEARSSFIISIEGGLVLKRRKSR